MSGRDGTYRVSAVVLAYGAEPWLERCVRSVLASTDVQVDVVLVDNGCTTGAVDAVKGLPGVQVIRPAENLGYAGGCRAGAAAATGDLLAFVNSDAIVAPDALAALARVAAEPAVGLAMGSIRLGSDPDLINTAGNPLHFTGLSWAGGCGEPASAYAHRRQVPCGSGCCFVIGAARWHEMGGFVEEFFAYHEDSELSLRLWQRGLSVEYVPDAVVVHHYEFSRNALKSYLLERNRLVLLLTTYQGRTLAVLAPMLLATEAAITVAAVAGGWGAAKARGWAWLWRHRAWIRARRARVQRERRVPDRALVPLITGEFSPSNLEALPGQRLYSLACRGYWALARRLI